MSRRFFYATLVPSLVGALTLGYIARGCPSQESTPIPQPPVEKIPQGALVDCSVVDPIAFDVVYDAAKQHVLPVHVGPYLAKNMCNALSVEAQYGIPAAGVLAKAGSEHSFGKNDDKIRKANNHFGIKYKEQYAAEYPNCVDATTWEFNPGNKITDCFVTYDSSLDSYLHFGEFLATRQIGDNKPYAEVMQHVGNSRDFLIALAASEYSTNPNEEQLTLGILTSFHLDDIVAAVKKDLPASAYIQKKESLGQEKVPPIQTPTPSCTPDKQKRVLEYNDQYGLELYSDCFEQGDLIVAKLNQHTLFTDSTLRWNIRKDDGTSRSFTLPKIIDGENIYALFGSDIAYPAQTGTLALDLVVDGKGIQKTYDVSIAAVTAKPQYLPADTQNAAPMNRQDNDALRREETLLYPSWESINRQQYFSLGYQHPVDGSCDVDEFGAARYIGGVQKDPHKGVDCDGAVGDPIYAVLGGKVALAEQGFFYTGDATVLDHGFGLYSYYAHQSKQTVFKEAIVFPGAKIGEIGVTGRTTGAHLHIGGKLYSMNVDPTSFTIIEEAFK